MASSSHLTNALLSDLEKKQRDRLNKGMSDAYLSEKSDVKASNGLSLLKMMSCLEMAPMEDARTRGKRTYMKSSRDSEVHGTKRVKSDLIPMESQASVYTPVIKNIQDETPDFSLIETKVSQKHVEPGEDIVEAFEKKLKFFKSQLISLISTTLASQDSLKNNEGSIKDLLLEYLKQVSALEPEFVLKLALYTRNYLNIRTLGNFILAFGAVDRSCSIYLKKYYSAIVVLPSDWIEVVTMVNMITSGHTIPRALRKVMIDKFNEFDDYQLAKYLKKGKKAESGLLTIKTLVRLLHIGQPADTILKILGKRYPKTLDEFYLMKLPGEWNPSRAGKRMKFDTIMTWETELSLHGNNTEVWEKLIDNKAIPYMALLRNLRNILHAKVSSRHDEMVIAKLQDEREVRRSRQFPLRFYNAYSEVLKLSAMDERVTFVPGKSYLQECASEQESESTGNQAPNRYTAYMAAVDKAFQISAKSNTDPIPGKTLVIIDVDELISDWNDKNLRPLILGLAVSKACEHSDVLFVRRYCVQKVHHDKFVGLRSLTNELFSDQFKSCNKHDVSDRADVQSFYSLFHCWNDITEIFSVTALWNALHYSNQWIDNVVFVFPGRSCIDDCWIQNVSYYKIKTNPNLLFAGISTSNNTYYVDEKPFDLYLSGFNDKILRFLSTRGDEGQINYVNIIDKIYGLYDPDIDGVRSNVSVERPMKVNSFIEKWKNVRIFVSSTFTDMHGERNMLMKYVFPELKARARKYHVNIYDIDLRWGISESDKASSAYLCLCEADKCDIFIGILGDRYGHVVENYDFSNEEKFRWLKSYPKGASITELEIEQAAFSKSLCDQKHVFFYFRDNKFLKEVPKELFHCFQETSVSSVEKLKKLKAKILKSGYEVYENYPCNFGGVDVNVAFVSGLNDFGQRVFLNVWNVLQMFYISDEKENAEDIEVMLTEAKMEELSSRPIVRCQTMKEFYVDLLKIIHSSTTRKFVILEGPVASGKTFFLSKLVRKCFTESDSTRQLILYYFCNNGAPIDVINIIRHFCKQLRAKFALSGFHESSSISFSHIFEEYKILLKEVKKREFTLLIIIDGLDQPSNEDNVESVSWLFPVYMKEITYLVTASENSNLWNQIEPLNTSVFRLNQLNQMERKALIRDTLCLYNKTLKEGPFCNQMRLLSMKKDCYYPFYVILACEELRNYAHFETLTEKIKLLPIDTFNLMKTSISRIKRDYTETIVIQTLAFLLCLEEGVTDKELYNLLRLYVALNDNHVALKHFDVSIEVNDESFTVSHFFSFLQSLQGILTPRYKFDNGYISFAHQNVKDYVLKFLISLHRHDLLKLTHKMIALFYWKQCDFNANCSWAGLNEKQFCFLPRHLIYAGCYEQFVQLMTDVIFIRSCLLLGVSENFIESIALFEHEYTKRASGIPDMPEEIFNNLNEIKTFLRNNRHILQTRPEIFFNIAKNENESSFIYREVSRRLEEMPHLVSSMILLKNKNICLNECSQVLYDFKIPITAVALSPNKEYLLVATNDFKIQYYSAATFKHVKTFIGHSNTVSALVFFNKDMFASSSFDNSVCVWAIPSGCRIKSLTDHENRVLALAVDNSNYMFASAGWDCVIIIRIIKSLSTHLKIYAHERPINALCFHPNESSLISGSWDKTIKVWDAISGTCVSKLVGHASSVCSLTVSSCGKFIYSGTLTGEFKVWNIEAESAYFTANSGNHCIRKLKKLPIFDTVALASEDGTLSCWGPENLVKMNHCFNKRDVFVSCIASCFDDVIVVGFSNGVIEAVRVRNLEILRSKTLSEAAPVLKIKTGCDTDYMVVSSANNTLYIVSCGSFDVICSIEQDNCLTSFDLIPFCRDDFYYPNEINLLLCATYDDSYAYFIEINEAVKELSQLKDNKLSLVKWRGNEAHESFVTCCSMLDDIAITGSKGGFVFVWNIDDRVCKMKRKIHSDWINDVVLFSGGKSFASVSNDCTLGIWTLSADDITSLKIIRSNTIMSSICCSGNVLLCLDYSRNLTILGTDKFYEICTFQLPDFSVDNKSAVCYSKNCDLSSDYARPIVYFVSTTGYIYHIQLTTLKRNSFFSVHLGACVDFKIVDSNKVLTFGEDGLVKEIRMEESNDDAPKLCSIMNFDLSPSGKYLVTADNDCALSFWDLSEPQNCTFMYKHETGLEQIKGISFISDEFTLTFTVLVAGDNRLFKVKGKKHEYLSSDFIAQHFYKTKTYEETLAVGLQLSEEKCVDTILIKKDLAVHEQHVQIPHLPLSLVYFSYRGRSIICCLSNSPNQLIIYKLPDATEFDCVLEEKKWPSYYTCLNVNWKMFAYPVLFVGDSSGFLHLYNLDNSVVIDDPMKLHEKSIVGIDSCDKSIWTCSLDHSIKVWTSDLSLVAELILPNFPHTIKLLETDTSAAVVSDNCKNLYTYRVLNLKF